jgi:hypothetical protein
LFKSLSPFLSSVSLSLVNVKLGHQSFSVVLSIFLHQRHKGILVFFRSGSETLKWQSINRLSFMAAEVQSLVFTVAAAFQQQTLIPHFLFTNSNQTLKKKNQKNTWTWRTTWRTHEAFNFQNHITPSNSKFKHHIITQKHKQQLGIIIISRP